MTPPGERNDISEGDQELTPEQSEAQMRRALETLSANAPRSAGAPAQTFGRPQNNRLQNDRPHSKNATGYSPGHSPGYPAPAARKHRFVQDGEVQVVHLPLQKDRPRDAGPAAVADQRPNRENVARETTARESGDRVQHDRPDRALLDAQSAVRGMQTKLAHAEIALSEAVQRANVQAEAAGAARADLQQARTDARAAEHTREMLELRLADQREKFEAEIIRLRAEVETVRRSNEPPSDQSIVAEPETAPAWPVQAIPLPVEVRLDRPAPMKRGRKPREKPPEVPEIEPEPVKWWLNTKPKPVRAGKTKA